MYCPNPSCQESPERPHLLISERSGIEIDYCPRCRGVWLDRGELDKLIERAQQDAAPAPQARQEPAREYRPAQPERHYPPAHHQDSHRKHYDDDHKHHSYGHYGKHKKKSLLSEIFDF